MSRGISGILFVLYGVVVFTRSSSKLPHVVSPRILIPCGQSTLTNTSPTTPFQLEEKLQSIVLFDRHLDGAALRSTWRSRKDHRPT